MKFARKLNLFDATMIVISGIIGSGIITFGKTLAIAALIAGRMRGSAR